MRFWNYMLVLAVSLTGVSVAAAGGIFKNRQKQTNPSQRVMQLIEVVRTSQSSSKRVDAVASLRYYDATAFPKIVTVLIDTLQNDNSINVRIEAARSLGRIRPLTKRAGDALAEAVSEDPAFRVRWQARTSLAFYTVAGLNPKNHAKEDSPPAANKQGRPKVITQEPPLDSSGKPIFFDQPVPPPDFSPNGPADPSYAKPLPKGPAQGPILTPAPQPLPNHPPGVQVPNKNSRNEPPLIGNVPPPPAGPNKVSPPVFVPSEGPILVPPP